MLHKRLLLPLLVICFASIAFYTSSAQSLRSGGYFCGSDGSCAWYKPGEPDWVFERFTYAMGYAECAGSIAEWRAKSPECRLVYYISGTDLPPYRSATSNSYNIGKKAYWIRNRLVQLGESEESAYLHFYDNTYLRHWNGSSYDTVMIPGTYSLVVDAADSVSRVPNSYVSSFFVSSNTYEYPTRLSPNFSSPKLRLAYKEYLTQIFNEQAVNHWPEATGTWDGIYFDNYSIYGMVGSANCGGGHVVESADGNGGMQVFGSDGYKEWTWELMKTFGREVRDTLQLADQWSVDGKKKILAYNVGLSHRDDYLDPAISGADALNIEFGFDPVYSNNYSYYRLENLHTRDSIAAKNGVTFFWTSIPRTAYGGGTTTKREAIYNNLCFYYVARSDSTWFFARPDPGNAYGVFLNSGFDTLAWIPAMEHDLGNPVGHYQLLDSGASPDQSGAEYKIWSRQYEQGLVLIRPRDGFDAAWGESSTAIEVDLGGSYRLLNADGTLGPETTSIALRGAAGAVLLPASGQEGSLDFAGAPRSGCGPLTVEFAVESTYQITAYSWDFGDGQTSAAASPSHTYNAPGQYDVSLTIVTPEGQQTVSDSNYVTICEPVVAAFSASTMSGEAPLAVSFTDASSGSPTSWQWSFGDGGSSNAQHPQHTFTAPGVYQVTLTVAGGCCTESSSSQLAIQVTEPEPVDNAEIHAIADTLLLGEEYGELDCGYRSDDIHQVVIEGTTNGHPRRRTTRAEYRWHFWKPAGTATINSEARRSPNNDGDDFVIECSFDNENFLPLFTVCSSGEGFSSARLPSLAGDTVYIRAVDTDASYGNLSLDTLYVDHLYLEIGGTLPAVDTLLISDIEVSRHTGKGKKEYAAASVLVSDQDGEPVSGVLVSGTFSGASSDQTAGLTDAEGRVTLKSRQVHRARVNWCFEVTDAELASHQYDPTRNLVYSSCEATASAKNGILPLEFALRQNVPNPFNPTTTIEFSLPQSSPMTLTIFNTLGQAVYVVEHSSLPAGVHQIVWDGRNQNGSPLASGLYLYRLQAGEFRETRKMLLLK